MSPFGAFIFGVMCGWLAAILFCVVLLLVDDEWLP